MARSFTAFGTKIREYVTRRHRGHMSAKSLRAAGAHNCLDFFQDQALIAVSNSYEAIRPAVAAGYLGLDIEAADKNDPSIIENFTKCGWTWDAETQLLHPVPITVPLTNSKASNGVHEAVAMFGGRGS